jgi:hypothetical protein
MDLASIDCSSLTAQHINIRLRCQAKLQHKLGIKYRSSANHLKERLKERKEPLPHWALSGHKTPHARKICAMPFVFLVNTHSVRCGCHHKSFLFAGGMDGLIGGVAGDNAAPLPTAQMDVTPPVGVTNSGTSDKESTGGSGPQSTSDKKQTLVRCSRKHSMACFCWVLMCMRGLLSVLPTRNIHAQEDLQALENKNHASALLNYERLEDQVKSIADILLTRSRTSQSDGSYGQLNIRFNRAHDLFWSILKSEVDRINKHTADMEKKATWRLEDISGDVEAAIGDKVTEAEEASAAFVRALNDSDSQLVICTRT